MTTTPRPRAPRQADIARLLGLSQATVSAVINSTGQTYGISEETRRKVMATVAELGYVPNPSARRLRSKRTGLLGLYTFEAIFPVTARDYYHGFLVGVEEQALESGYDMVLFTSTAGPDGRRSIYRDGSNRLNIADGSVLMGVEHGSAELTRLAAENYPFVHVGRRAVPGHQIAYVGADYMAATADVVRRLHDLGHRHIAYLAEPERIEAMLDRRAGYRAGCEAVGITPMATDDTPPTSEWLDAARGHGVTAVLTENKDLAEDLAGVAGAAGLAIPDALSVVVLNSPDAAGRFGWSAIGIPRTRMGRTAVRLLVAMLTRPESVTDWQPMLACDPPGPATMARAATAQP